MSLINEYRKACHIFKLENDFLNLPATDPCYSQLIANVDYKIWDLTSRTFICPIFGDYILSLDNSTREWKNTPGKLSDLFACSPFSTSPKSTWQIVVRPDANIGWVIELIIDNTVYQHRQYSTTNPGGVRSNCPPLGNYMQGILVNAEQKGLKKLCLSDMFCFAYTSPSLSKIG